MFVFTRAVKTGGKWMMTKDGSQSPPETFARNNSIRYLKSNLYIIFIYLFCYWSDWRWRGLYRLSLSAQASDWIFIQLPSPALFRDYSLISINNNQSIMPSRLSAHHSPSLRENLKMRQGDVFSKLLGKFSIYANLVTGQAGMHQDFYLVWLSWLLQNMLQTCRSLLYLLQGWEDNFHSIIS